MSVKRKSTDGLENESTGKKHPKTSKVKLEKSSNVKPQSSAEKTLALIKSKHHDRPNKQDKKSKQGKVWVIVRHLVDNLCTKISYFFFSPL